MVFSSPPLFLDPPNWQHQAQPNPNHEIQNPQPPVAGAGAGASNSMGERARLAKIPAPEGPIRCPRPGCESTNTKFCYYNNYNLSQPRHFCKACRRYWTRGGALRNVPVGGACRRNKRRKNNNNAGRSKSPISAAGGEAGNKAANNPAPAADHRLFPPVGAVSAAPYSFMASLTSLGMGNLGQLGGYGAPAHQQQLSLLAGYGAAPNNSGYPFQLVNETGMETASFGGGSARPLRPLLGGGGGVTENSVGQFWSAHINNINAAAGSSGLWTDLSGMN